jgi:hypothetical protein
MTHASVEFLGKDLEHSIKCEIAAEIQRSFGSLRLQATGHSMLPSILPGDTLVIEQRNFAQIAPGDIVLYIRQNKLVAHRVLRTVGTIGNPQLIIQGDALPNQDAPVSSLELLGRVSGIIRDGQRIRHPARLTVATRCVACILRHSASLSRLLVHLHTKRASSQNREALCNT